MNLMNGLRRRAEAEAAVEAVRAALGLVLARQGAEDVRLKAPGDPVTATDIAAQAQIQQVLAARCPGLGFVGEEGAFATPTDGAYWLVDPICGTSNYAAGLPLYAINVALVEAGQVTLGCVGDGATGEVYLAERGQGAWLLRDAQAERLQASVQGGLVSVDPQLGGPGELGHFGRAFAVQAIEAGRFKVRVLATTLALAYVARGRLAAAVYARSGLAVHFAAGLLLAEAAGARVSDHRGQPWRVDSPIYVAAADPALHAELCGMAQQVVASLGTAAG